MHAPAGVQPWDRAPEDPDVQPHESKASAASGRRSSRGGQTTAQADPSMPSRDPQDPNYRRLRYIRYVDDWLLGFCGPRSEAEEIKARIAEFLREHLKRASQMDHS